MKIINLKQLYPFIESNYFCEVSDEIANCLMKFRRQEHAANERKRVHRAYYSLDAGNGIENEIVVLVLSPEEIYERKLIKNELYAAINRLPKKQAQRIYAYFFLGFRKSEIARQEGVEQSAVGRSIESGLKKMEKYIKIYKKFT